MIVYIVRTGFGSKPYLLEENWTCVLTEITLTSDFKPRSFRLYLCSDIVQESYVRNALIEIVRNIEIGTRYKKVKSESYPKSIHVPVKVSTLDRIRLEFKDENLQPLELNSNDLHCVLHFKRDGYSRSIRLQNNKSGFHTFLTRTNGINICSIYAMIW